MANKASFNIRGITLHLPDGDVTLNAGTNMTIFPQGDLITFSVQLPPNIVYSNLTAYQPPSISDANAPKGSIYFSITASKLVYKDSAGAVHNLY